MAWAAFLDQPPLRTLFLSDRLSARGGADRHLLGVLHHLRGRAATLLLHGHDDGSLPPEERAHLGPQARLKGLERSGLSPRGGRAAAERLAQAIADFRPQVIQAQNIMDPALLAAVAASGRGVALVQDHRFFCPGLGMLTPAGALCSAPLGPGCLACFQDPDYGRRLLALTQARLEALRGMRRVLTLSAYMAQRLAAAGLPPELIRVIPPFVHGLERPAPPPPPAHHLLACRLVERKGVLVALQAAASLPAGQTLVVAGDGPLAGEVERAARGSGGRVRWVGWASRREMTELLARAWSLWLPSLWAEPFGIAGLEALALGTPVAASAVGGVGEWLEPGVGGFLLPPGDAAALARAAAELATPRGREMGRAGAEAAARRHRADDLMARLLRCHREVAG